jgi:hypothetical protein
MASVEPGSEGVQAGPQDDVLADAVPGLLDHQVLDEAGAGHHARPVPAGGAGVHVRAAAPAVAGGRQPQADLVFEHVGRWVNLDVHGPP